MSNIVKNKAIAWVLVVALIMTIIPQNAFAEDKVDLDNPTKANVIEDENTENTTTFDVGRNKKMTVFHGGNVRFKNEEGKLEDYDSSLVAIKKGEKTENKISLEEYEVKNKTGDMKHYLPEHLSENTPILMEKEKHEIAIIPIGEGNKEILDSSQSIEIEKEKVPGVYTKEEEKPLKAVYGKDENVTYEYISGSDGIKENLIFKQQPDTNVFEYKIKLKGMYARKNSTTEGITFYDKENDDIKGAVEAPFMNDASGEAYSKDIKCELKETKEKDTYILSMIIDEDYARIKESSFKTD